MSKFIETDKVKKLITDRYINVSIHPETGYLLYSYTRSASLGHVWTPETRMCRGLIVDPVTREILARPFEKFWNIEELQDSDIPEGEKFWVTEKLDGSLGILYWVGDEPRITTKGSWESDQGAHATRVLQTKYRDRLGELRRDVTYLFEIIYPGDPHIVKYGDTDDIFLLAVIDTETGKDLEVSGENHGIFKTTKSYDGITDWRKVRDLWEGDNREGFVVRFESGYRVKLKYDSYFKLHFLKSQLTEKHILEVLEAGGETLKEARELIKGFPEEDQVYFEGRIKEFMATYWDILGEAIGVWREAVGDGKTEAKDVARIICSHPYQGVIWNLWNGKSLDTVRASVWKYVREWWKSTR